MNVRDCNSPRLQSADCPPPNGPLPVPIPPKVQFPLNVADWLRTLGLEAYEPAFARNDIDGTVLAELTADDLTALGVSSIGHRRKLLAAIALLKPSTTPAEPPSARAPGTAAERRQLSVMFCDLVGSTPLSTRLDPEDLRQVLGIYHAAVTDEVNRAGGYVAKYMGDGVLAYFGYPQAHENEAEHALRAGLAVVERITSLDAHGATLAVRVGIATGVVVVGDLLGRGDAQERGVVGETPNLAARLQSMAKPGTVLLDDATRRLVGGLFDWRAHGTVPVRGIDRPVAVWQALCTSNVESRFEALRATNLTPLVGRGEEVDLLLRRWQSASQGEGRVALLSGEPGIGKSRLAEALQERLADVVHQRLRCFCSPHHRGSPLQPFIAQLERDAGFVSGDSDETKRDKLLTLLGPSDLSAHAPFADLLGLPTLEAVPEDSQRRRERMLGAMLERLEVLARQRPLLILFEDAHWADSTSLELLDRIIERIARLPMMLIVSFRPEFQPSWVGQAHVSALTLNRLGERDTASVVNSVTAGKSLPPEILARIVERTDGIPLFVEELTKTLIEGGMLREADDAFVLDKPLLTLAIPSSLQASLLARLDRLAPVKEVAQIGAAIGREFAYDLLLAVAARSEAELEQALAQLVDAGLVFQRGTPPTATYLFKHALVQDAAYSTLLRDHRQALHARIAAALEAGFPDIVRNQPETLAHHFTQAGLTGEAVTCWQRAGGHAQRRSANVEAIGHFKQAIALIASLPAGQVRDERELGLQLALGPALMASRGYGVAEVEATYGRARDLCRHLDSGPRLFAVLRGLWEYYEIRANLKEGGEIAREVLRIAEQSGDRTLRLVAHDVMGDTLLWAGDFSGCVEHTRRAIALYDPVQDRHIALDHGGYDPSMAARVFGAHALWYLGRGDEALAQCEDAIAFARALDHPPTSVMVGQVALHHCLRGEPEAARRHAEAALELAAAHDFKFWLANAGISRGWAVAMQGSLEGIEEMKRGIAAYRATGAALEMALWSTFLAEGLLLHSEVEEARAVVDEAIADAERTGVRLHLAEMHRLRGEALHRLGARDQARAALQHAREIARGQGAKLLEARAAASQVRLG